ncbi:MAG TPA: response regulator [Saprospiraceae bacterium]|nr:response regulator [Saprospiraceae bacterium]
MPLKICVVEDNIIVADLLCSVLLHFGYSVTEPALSYNMALLIIEKENPDLLLLDIDLSGEKNGIDLAWKLKNELHLPFAFVTAQSDNATFLKAQETDPFAYLLKPVDQELLVNSIESGYQQFFKHSTYG